MTPEQRLALYGGALGVIGVVLVLVAVALHGWDRRRQT